MSDLAGLPEPKHGQKIMFEFEFPVSGIKTFRGFYYGGEVFNIITQARLLSQHGWSRVVRWKPDHPNGKWRCRG